MKSSSHNTWQTSLLFLKPLQIQTLKRKKWGEPDMLCPPRLKKWGGHVPRVPHQIAPMASASVGRDSWLFGVVVAAGVFSACAGFVMSCNLLFYSVFDLFRTGFDLLSLTAVLTNSALCHWELKWNLWLAFCPTVVVLWCSNVDYVVSRLCGFFCCNPVPLVRWGSSRSCPFPTLDGWVTSSSWLITRTSWGCNDWRRPCWSGRRLSRHDFIYICTLHVGGSGSSGFVKDTTFSFPGLACSTDCGFAVGLNLWPFTSVWTACLK